MAFTEGTGLTVESLGRLPSVGGMGTAGPAYLFLSAAAVGGEGDMHQRKGAPDSASGPPFLCPCPMVFFLVPEAKVHGGC